MTRDVAVPRQLLSLSLFLPALSSSGNPFAPNVLAGSLHAPHASAASSERHVNSAAARTRTNKSLFACVQKTVRRQTSDRPA